MKIKELYHVSLTPNISAKTFQIVHVDGVLELSGPASFKSVPGIEN